MLSDELAIIDNVKEVQGALGPVAPFSIPILKLNVVVYYDDELKTLAKTDGHTLFINGSAWSFLSLLEKEFILLHEWIHISALHAHRKGNRDWYIWYLAADFFANGIILGDDNVSTWTDKDFDKRNRLKPPSGSFYDPAYKDLSTEEIFEDLLKRSKDKKPGNKPSNKEGSSDGKGKGGGKGNGKSNFNNADDAAQKIANGNEKDKCDLENPPADADPDDLKQDIIKAAEFHKKTMGKIPGNYERLINKIKKNKTDYKKILTSVVREVVYFGNNRSYCHPKRWGFFYGLILPGEVSKQKTNIVIIYDTSASISDDIIAEFNGELVKILPYASTCTIITADVKVHEVVKIRQISDIVSSCPKVKFKGKGGTDFREALKAAMKLNPDLIIYFTDGIGQFGNRIAYSDRLLWVLTRNSQVVPPFGRYIVMD